MTNFVNEMSQTPQGDGSSSVSLYERMKAAFSEYGKEVFSEVMAVIPPCVRAELEGIARSRKNFPEGLSEIRLHRCGRNFLLLSGRIMPLRAYIDGDEWRALTLRVTSGALYAHRDTLAEGYISMGSGIRVGACAEGRYEGGRFVFSGNISSLVFRIPSSVSEHGEEIFRYFMRRRCGILIYSKPLEGKTSALRAIGYFLGAEARVRTVIVDERREMPKALYSALGVDVLRGYGKAKGIEIAMRTLGAEAVLIDEIGSAAEAEAIAEVGNGGVAVIATSHAPSSEVLLKKRGIGELVASGYFGALAGLRRELAGDGATEKFCLNITEV